MRARFGLDSARIRSLAAALAVLLATAGVVHAIRGGLKSTGWICPDFVCFWAAGKNLAAGHSPYDAARQTLVQREYGWNKATHGLGIYDFMPYFYPPWFGMLIAPLVPLGASTARVAWLVLNAEMLVLAALLLRDAVPGVPRLVAPIAVVVFSHSVSALLMGQTTLLILLLVALAWRLLEHRRDAWAGAVLAWLTIKPQLAGILILAVGLWAIRQRRWGVVRGFILTLGALALASTLIVPSWLVQMLQAPGRTPVPTHYFPWAGTTWLLVLRTIGLRSWALWVPYAAVAIPFLGLVLWRAADPACPLKRVLALSLLATFFVAPYCQAYDFPVLLIPFLVFLEDSRSERLKGVLTFVVIVLPYVHLGYLTQISLWWIKTKPPFHGVTLFWVPLLLTGVWALTAARRRRPAPALTGDLLGLAGSTPEA